jgi:hypothetical protein
MKMANPARALRAGGNIRVAEPNRHVIFVYVTAQRRIARSAEVSTPDSKFTKIYPT